MAACTTLACIAACCCCMAACSCCIAACCCCESRCATKLAQHTQAAFLPLHSGAVSRREALAVCCCERRCTTELAQHAQAAFMPCLSGAVSRRDARRWVIAVVSRWSRACRRCAWCAGRRLRSSARHRAIRLTFLITLIEPRRRRVVLVFLADEFPMGGRAVGCVRSPRAATRAMPGGGSARPWNRHRRSPARPNASDGARGASLENVH